MMHIITLILFTLISSTLGTPLLEKRGLTWSYNLVHYTFPGATADVDIQGNAITVGTGAAYFFIDFTAITIEYRLNTGMSYSLPSGGMAYFFFGFSGANTISEFPETEYLQGFISCQRLDSVNCKAKSTYIVYANIAPVQHTDSLTSNSSISVLFDKVDDEYVSGVIDNAPYRGLWKAADLKPGYYGFYVENPGTEIATFNIPTYTFDYDTTYTFASMTSTSYADGSTTTFSSATSTSMTVPATTSTVVTSTSSVSQSSFVTVTSSSSIASTTSSSSSVVTSSSTAPVGSSVNTSPSSTRTTTTTSSPSSSSSKITSSYSAQVSSDSGTSASSSGTTSTTSTSGSSPSSSSSKLTSSSTSLVSSYSNTLASSTGTTITTPISSTSTTTTSSVPTNDDDKKNAAIRSESSINLFVTVMGGLFITLLMCNV